MFQISGTWKKRKVAIKKLRIPADRNDQKDLMEDLVKECTILSHLRHPNILALLGSYSLSLLNELEHSTCDWYSYSVSLGLCTTPPNLAIVTEYMSRSHSLHQNQQVKIELNKEFIEKNRNVSPFVHTILCSLFQRFVVECLASKWTLVTN